MKAKMTPPGSDDNDDPLLGAERDDTPRHRWVPHPALSFLHVPLYSDCATLTLRVVTALLIIHHGLDKLEHTDAFARGVIAAYFPFLPGPPELWTYLAAATELVGSTCLAAGVCARPAALALAATMLNALALHLMKFGPQSFPLNPEARGAYTYEPCLAFAAVTIHFAFAGPGRLALRPHGF